MSFSHPEKRRQCQRCGHQWWAEHYGPLDGFGILINDRQAEARREHYRACSSCGSTSVRDIRPAKPLSKRATRKQEEAAAREQEQRAASEAKAAKQRQKLAGMRRKDVAQALAQPPVGQRVG